LVAASNQNNYLLTKIAQIKSDIIKRSEKHASDLENLDYTSVMTFYANNPDSTVFGDGYHWGDYLTIDGLWKKIFGKNG